MKGLRILHLVPSLSGGGAERQCSYLVSELCRIGHQVGVGYIYDGPVRPELSGVKMYQLEAKGNYDPYILWQVVKLIREFRADVVQTWIVQMDVLGGIAARIAGVPWILREPSTAQEYSSGWKPRLRAWTGRYATAIVSNSAGGDSYWKSKYPHKPRYVIPNGIMVDDADGELSAEQTGRNRYLLYAGRLQRGKNIDKVIEAFARAVAERSMHLIICGDGPSRNSLEALVRSLGIADRVEFTGFVAPAQVKCVMKRASVFVFVSDYEGFPNALAEAMACGCPLVVSDIAAHRELLDEECAVFVNPRDPVAIAEAIRTTLADKDAAERRGKMAGARTLQFSVSLMARRYEEVYIGVMSRPLENQSSVPSIAK